LGILNGVVIGAISILLAVTGLWLMAGALGRLRRRPVRGALRMMTGGTLTALAALLWLAALSLQGFYRLTGEAPVAEIRFTQIGAQRYTATLTTVGGGGTAYELAGDEWQLDARVLKWHGYAQVLGFDNRYRLERLGGRYRDLAAERHAPRTVVDLAADPPFDLWAVIDRHPHWLPLVDAVYGSAAYLPMRDGARYLISLGASGLIAREAE